jgi:acyl transferase domain-containing protein
MSHEEKDGIGMDGLGGGNGLEVAVIGMAGRFPGAENIEEYWRNLRDGVESLTVLSGEELKLVPPEIRRSPHYVPVARMIPDYDLFDAAFFGVNPREADVMDPQQRLFLECAWTALEHAGYDPERYPGPVGVYAGARMNFYLWNVYSNPALVRAVGDLASQIANEKDYLATRVSYKLNLGGPSLTVQSACSTSLVAVHLACQGLFSGECDMAIAGGISIRIPEIGYLSTDGDVNSPDGHVRSFDAKAGGTVFGSGMGAVVLKRLADALADGDSIHAVIKGSAMTNDGSQKVGFTAPGVDGQVRVIRAALTVADVEPEQISYVEAHGTGTPVGDPIEITALTKVFREKTDARGYCALGTVKANIGHLGTAAGVAGLIKTVLALKHKTIPPSLLFEQPNPQIDFASSPFFVNTQLREWEADGAPRRAGVSAFGMGGTNAHAIVEEAPEPEPTDPSRPWQLLLLSARTETALAAQTANLAAHLEAHPQDDLADVAYTLQVGRKLHEHRRAVVCRDASHARQALGELAPEWVSTAFAPGRERGVAFLFSGQGSQYVGMGKGLYATEAAFREQVDLCCERLQQHLGLESGLDLRDLLFASEDDAAAGEQLGQTQFTQPALFVIEHALARLWMEWGLSPKAMLGHSIGEYVAACLAGVMSLDDALALVAERGRLMASLPSGSMLVVPLPEAEVTPLLGGQLALAAVNAPDRCVVSGPHEAVAVLQARLTARGVGARPLHTSHAFHSGMMEPILAPFLQRFAGIELHAPQIPYVSNVTGTWITEAEATDPGYWTRHLRQAVRFADGIRELCKDGTLVLLEVGPGQSLATLARQHPERGAGRVVLSSLRHPKDPQEDLAVLLKTLGQLWLAGVQPDWRGFYARERRRRIPLPTYPFERRRFWVEPGEAGAATFGWGGGSEIAKKEDVADWFYLPYWKPSLPPAAEDIGGRWLLFLDGAGVGDRVATRLASDGASVITVTAGGSFQKLGDGGYEIAPARREDYDALLKDLAAAGRLPDRVLHLWNVGPIETQTDPADLSFWSLLFLAQAFGRNNVTQPVRMAIASSHMQRVAGEDRLLAERALLLGPAKIIPQEYANVRCVSVDIELPVTDAILGRLIAEAAAEPSRHGVVAYRSGRRWVQDYEAVHLEAPAARVARFRERGVYLITGGLGGLGLTFAEFLAREFQARLILLGVSALPEREAWDEWLRSHGEGDRISQRIRKLRELEELGAEVMVVSADAADREQMRAAIGAGLERFGAIHGAIHAAGLAGGGMIQLKTAEMANRVLSPKLAGTRSLLAALSGVPLDFVVFCSSTIAVAGGLGQVDYCAANNFLDALAHESALAGGPPAISINWGAWEEVGMAVAAGLMSGRGGVPAPRKDGPAEDIHPLLDRCVLEMADQTIYETDFSPSRHWVLSEHKIMNVPTLPGTTYLELARAAFLHHAAAFEGYPPDGGVELRDVFFLSPLLLPEAEREVQVFLEKEGSSFNFRVASRVDSATGRGEPSWQPHARGRVAALPSSALSSPPGRERWDVDEILARCREREMEITGPVMSQGESIVYWGAHWQSLKRIHLGAGEALAEIELPAEFADEAARYGLHPALLDVATGMAGFFEENSYLPLSYHGVKVHRPLPQRFFSYLRRHGETGTGGETIAVDVVILTDGGEAIVEIDRFTMKRVAESAGNLKRAAEAPAAVAAPEEATPGAVPKVTAELEVVGGILPQEGVEALRRVLSRELDAPQIVVTAKDLHALIEQVSSLNRSSLMDSAGAGSTPQAVVHARPNIPTPYVAPTTENERRLAEVWQATLGIEEVGVNDNFFDLGGDSILGIQVIARAAQAGLQLSPDQLFEHQTIADLASLFATVPQDTVDAATGFSPVTSFQRELLETGAAPCWYAVWPLPPGVQGSEIVGRALVQVVARHEALRTRFEQGPQGWIQEPVAAPGILEVRQVDGVAAPEEMGIEALVSELGAGLDPTRGVLVAAAVLSEGEDSQQRALVVAHPLAADGGAWRSVREELETACTQLAAGVDVLLPSDFPEADLSQEELDKIFS